LVSDLALADRRDGGVPQLCGQAPNPIRQMEVLRLNTIKQQSRRRDQHDGRYGGGEGWAIHSVLPTRRDQEQPIPARLAPPRGARGVGEARDGRAHSCRFLVEIMRNWLHVLQTVRTS